MSVFVLDSSALVKRYVTETGTSWVSNVLDPASPPEWQDEERGLGILGYSVNRSAWRQGYATVWYAMPSPDE